MAGYCVNVGFNIRDYVFLVGRGSWGWSAASKLGQVHLPRIAYRCLLDVTLKAVGPFCLVSVSGEVIYPTQNINVQPVMDSTF